jgi:hypothetical protein
MKKYYFFSYCIQTCVPGKSILHNFRNEVGEIHPFKRITEIKESTVSIPNLIHTEVTLLNYREISETEYLLFQN